MKSPYERRPKDAVGKVFTVRTSGTVFLFGPELEILDTPEFQRLAGIKQLGTSYFVFRGAVHTRFEHALGAVHTAQKIIESVNRNPYAKRTIMPREMRLARLFALLHDVPHVPFGHTLEDEFGLLTRHDKNAARIDKLLWNSRIGAILEEAIEPDELVTLKAMIAADGDAEIAKLGLDAFLVDIVANTVCADAIDYIQRDLEACGMPVELGDRFLDFFVVTGDDVPASENRNRMALALEKRGMPRPDVESEVVKLLSYRYELAERVYFHHAKNAASVMIGRAVQALGLDARDENFHELSDDVLLAILRRPAIADALDLDVHADADRELAAELGTLLDSRRLFKIAYLGVADDFGYRISDVYSRYGRNPAARTELENRLADMAGVSAGQVLVHLPPEKMAEKLANVRVQTTDGVVIRLQEWDDQHTKRVSALNAAHRRLWRVAVYVHPDLPAAERRLVKAAAEAIFGVPSRYVPDDGPTGYLEELFDLVAAAEEWTLDDRQALVGQPLAADAYATRAEAEALIRGLVEARRATGEQVTPAPAPVPAEAANTQQQDGTGEQRLPGMSDSGAGGD